jgi:aryl-alcohol dehydrogenase-like predicted oxidoreductase
MTFGTEWGWGADEDVSRAVFHRYLEEGGNFVDTANGYTNGKSEELLGRFITEDGLRDRIVLATKFTFNTQPGDPNAGGNGRKNIYRSLEASLRRLRTDYVDLYWLHAWDTITPVEEVVSTFDDLVRAGKIRHYGFSDTPAWYAARAHTLAEKEGKERLIALQLEYSLVERNIEREHIPAAQELGLAVCPWSPLGGGFLSGKYKREGKIVRGDGRHEKVLAAAEGNPAIRKLTEQRFGDRNWQILSVLTEVAKEVGGSPAQVALNWVATQPGIVSPIIGATKVAQLNDNLAALSFVLPSSLRERLDAVSVLEPAHPYAFFAPMMQAMISGGAEVEAWRPARATGAPIEIGAPRQEVAA